MTDGDAAVNPLSRGNVASGLTKREYFAALSLQGLMAYSAKDRGTIVDAAKLSVAAADALIKELNS